jgi:hypothetical protein
VHGAHGGGRVRQPEQLAERRPQVLGRDEIVAQARQARFDAPLGFGGKAHAVPRHEFEQAQGKLGLHVEPLGRAKMNAFGVFVSVFCTGEIRKGIASLPASNRRAVFADAVK